MYVVNDGGRKKTDFVLRLFFVCSLWWSKRKNSFCDTVIFYMLSMMEPGKKLILFKDYFLYVVYDGAREKTYSFLTLFFVWFLWWLKEKIHSVIRYFLYVIYNGVIEKTQSVRTLFFVCCPWSSKRKNSFSYNVIFCMVCMIKQEKKLNLL